MLNLLKRHMSQHSQIREENETNQNKGKEEMFVSKYRVASLLMGLLICLMGLVFSTVEPIKACNFTLTLLLFFKYFSDLKHFQFENQKGTKCEDPLKIFIELFYLYMYTVSIIWMGFMRRSTNIKIRTLKKKVV